ncbi:hypothetical protein [Phyllobacterium sp. SB3]|uniref:hypothetical protein n=1 Tax=Phyllobacterium sp. SB3 TaxID=3156073 RepID=UPI0032AEC90A
MTSRLANDELTLLHGENNTVRLRPSLRAASKLERLHDGFFNLERRILEFHFGTVREIIMIAATDRQEATAFLAYLDTVPLKHIPDVVIPPILALCKLFLPAPEKSSKPVANPGKPVSWPDYYADLYEKATGWLGWTPDTAWNATPTEIDRAYSGLIAKLKAIHGSSEDEKQPAKTAPDADLADRMKADGLDPQFDREGLRALKMKIASAA